MSFDADVVFVEAKPAFRARSRSDVSSRFKGKIAWLRDRRDQTKATIAEHHEEEAVAVKPHRPRTRSDSKWIKNIRKSAVEKEKAATLAAFDWPLVAARLEKLKQKCAPTLRMSKDLNKEQRVERSQSVAGLTNHEAFKVNSKLKRRGSEQQPRGKKAVAFENSGGLSNWWSSSMKMLFDKGKASRPKGQNGTKRRHFSSDPRNFFCKHSDFPLIDLSDLNQISTWLAIEGLKCLFERSLLKLCGFANLFNAY